MDTTNTMGAPKKETAAERRARVRAEIAASNKAKKARLAADKAKKAKGRKPDKAVKKIEAGLTEALEHAKKTKTDTPAATAKAPKEKKEKLTKEEKAKLRIETTELLPGVKLSANTAPGVQIVGQLQAVFDRLNDKLFENKVEPCVLLVAKLKRSYGHFWHSQFANRDDLNQKLGEIGIDLRRIAEKAASENVDVEVMSTILHEMCHAYVFQIEKAEAAATGKEFKPKTYHCTTWAALMKKVGLQPVAIGHDGQPNGKETGPHATHTIIPDGVFEVAARDMLAEGFKFSWASVGGFYDQLGKAVSIKVGKDGTIEFGEGDSEPRRKKSRAGAKAKHTCPTCGGSMWGKPSAVLHCHGTVNEKHDPVEMTCDRGEYEGEGSDE